jgi:hypothetical protein
MLVKEERLMVDALARDAYQKALYRHMYRIMPLLERIDTELEKAVMACERARQLKAMRSISVFGLFDFDFYTATYRQVPTTEFEALEHYTKYGEAEGLKPNVAFSPFYYRDQSMAGAASEQNALQHYSEAGERIGRKASLAFDPRIYLKANPALAAFVDRPMFHFLKLGLPAGLPLRPPLNNNSSGHTVTFDATVGPLDQAHWRRLKDELDRLDDRRAPQSVGRNLVIGLALNYRKADLAPFVRSLRATGYNGDIVLWVSSVDPETRELFDEHRVNYEYYWEMSFFPFDFMLARNFSYYRYLCDTTNRKQGFDRILLTDVADVVFQSDPFANAPGGDLVVFLEDKVRTLDTCYVDSYWIRSAFGDLALDEVRGRRMSCAGTVLGSLIGILRYLLIMQLGAFECAPPARLLEGIDQAIHNVMLYRGRLLGAVIVDNAEHVFTMGIVPKNHVVITQGGKITDLGGRICPIIHQYDRHPAVTRFVQEQYVGICEDIEV